MHTAYGKATKPFLYIPRAYSRIGTSNKFNIRGSRCRTESR